MRTVILLAEFGSLNGGENSILAAIPNIACPNLRFKAIVPAPSEFATALNGIGVNSHPIWYLDLGGMRKQLGEIRDSIALLVRQLKPDLIHANSLSTSRMLGPLKDEFDVPMIGHLRDIVGISRQMATDINRLDRLIAVSDATKRWHVTQGLDENKIEVVFNGVDLDRFRPGTPTGWLHRLLNIDPAVPLVLSVGQIGVRKGLDVTLAAAEKIAEEHQFELVFVGQRHSEKSEAIEFENQLLTAAEEGSLNGRVHWLGRRRDVARIMNECAMLVQASRQEPLGRVILEALACGLPVIASDAGGTPEIFAGYEQAGEIFATDEKDQLASALSTLLGSETRRRELSRAGRHLAESRFGIAPTADQLSHQYEAAMTI